MKEGYVSVDAYLAAKGTWPTHRPPPSGPESRNPTYLACPCPAPSCPSYIPPHLDQPCPTGVLRPDELPNTLVVTARDAIQPALRRQMRRNNRNVERTPAHAQVSISLL